MSANESYPYTPVLGWSVSRYDMFSACRRQYYYQYYHKHDTQFGAERIARLRALVSVPLQIGTVTHDCIAAILNRLLREPTEPVDHARLAEFVFRKAAEKHRGARYGEVHYGERAAVEAEDVASPSRDAIASLCASERFAWLVARAGHPEGEWVVDTEGYGETRVDGLKAYCKVDFLIPAEGRLHILDWKTGKEREERHAVQLRGYAAWASHRFGVPAERIAPTVAYLLPAYREVSVTLNQYDMQDFATLVRTQTHEMQALCRDVEQNLPLPKDRFPLTSVESMCTYCNYRELCGRAPSPSA
jgi:hypothetical protein